MYEYEYEEDILQMLRILKFLYLQDPDACMRIAQEVDEAGIDELFEISEMAVWELFYDVDFTSVDEFETTEIAFMHTELDRFLQLSNQMRRVKGVQFSLSNRKKLQDAFLFYVGFSRCVFDLGYTFYEECVQIRIVQSPDCYDCLEFGNAMVDFLLYIRQENACMEAALREAPEAEEETTIQEAA